MPSPFPEASITAVCNDVMRGVVATGCMTGASDAKAEAACVIMRAELKAAVFGEEYADARQAVAAGSLNPAYMMGLIVAECVAKIAAFTETAEA